MSSLADVVHVARRFRKSVRVDSDLSEASALEGYVCPPSGVHILRHMAAQVAETGQGAFTWTGPYGGGKSSLALLLASLLGQNEKMKVACARSLARRTPPISRSSSAAAARWCLWWDGERTHRP